jgi:hypothetical protein
VNLVIRFFIGMPMKAIATAGHACIQSSGIGQDPHRFSKKIGQNRFHDPAPQTRRFLSVSIIVIIVRLSNDTGKL